MDTKIINKITYVKATTSKVERAAENKNWHYLKSNGDLYIAPFSYATGLRSAPDIYVWGYSSDVLRSVLNLSASHKTCWIPEDKKYDILPR